MGFLGAGVLAAIVFGINYHGTHNLTDASTAALKQGTYTFLFGGIIMRGCENLATRISKQAVALAAATIIPSAVAISLTFGVHNLKGTPKPIESTIPTAVFVIPSTAIWGYRKRKQNTILTSKT
jgi:peptidoglycan/LPS O-acetylase OafA/YrhL